MQIFSDINIWLTIVGLLGAYLAWRLIDHYRDRSAFADYDDQPRLDRWVRALTSMTVVFLILGIVGFGLILTNYVLTPFVFDPPETVVTAAPTATAAIAVEASPTLTSSPTKLVPSATPSSQPTDSPTSTPDIPVQGEIGNTNFQGVNLRVTPSLTGEVITKLINGTIVFVLPDEQVEADGFVWQAIALENGEQGWIAIDFLVLTED